MTYEQLVQFFAADDKYATYLAKRFLSPKSLEEIALSEGLPEGAYHRLFTDFPEFEQKFKSKVTAEDEETKDMFLRQAASKALQRLSDIINDPEVKDNKDIIQACRAVLGYKPAGKKPNEKNPLASIFDDLVEQEDER